MITHHHSCRITELPCCIKVTGYIAGHTAVSIHVWEGCLHEWLVWEWGKKASAATAAMLVKAGRMNKATRPADPFILFFLQAKLYCLPAKALSKNKPISRTGFRADEWLCVRVRLLCLSLYVRVCTVCVCVYSMRVYVCVCTVCKANSPYH